MTRTISIFSAAVLSLSLFGTGIDNAPLLPKWVGDSEVKLECLSQDATASPDWVKSLIIVEANVATASTDGTLAGICLLYTSPGTYFNAQFPAARVQPAVGRTGDRIRTKSDDQSR